MLLQKNTPFGWTQLQQDAFESVKKIFARNVILQHFNPYYQTCLETDSSSYGIGEVLMQRKSNSVRWLPNQFASRTLNAAERNYSQLEREALSVIFGIDKFRNFLLGSNFIIKNDHKLLNTLFAKDKPVPQTCSARVLRGWSLKLKQFNYVFQYSCGKDNVHSDFLSRLPLPDTVPEVEPFELIFAVNSIESELIDHKTVKDHSARDPDFFFYQPH